MYRYVIIGKPHKTAKVPEYRVYDCEHRQVLWFKEADLMDKQYKEIENAPEYVDRNQVGSRQLVIVGYSERVNHYIVCDCIKDEPYILSEEVLDEWLAEYSFVNTKETAFKLGNSAIPIWFIPDKDIVKVYEQATKRLEAFGAKNTTEVLLQLLKKACKENDGKYIKNLMALTRAGVLQESFMLILGGSPIDLRNCSEEELGSLSLLFTDDANALKPSTVFFACFTKKTWMGVRGDKSLQVVICGNNTHIQLENSVNLWYLQNMDNLDYSGSYRHALTNCQSLQLNRLPQPERGTYGVNSFKDVIFASDVMRVHGFASEGALACAFTKPLSVLCFDDDADIISAFSSLFAKKNVKEMDTKIDCIVITNPNAVNTEVVSYCVQNGCSLIVTKGSEMHKRLSIFQNNGVQIEEMSDEQFARVYKYLGQQAGIENADRPKRFKYEYCPDHMDGLPVHKTAFRANFNDCLGIEGTAKKLKVAIIAGTDGIFVDEKHYGTEYTRMRAIETVENLLQNNFYIYNRFNNKLNYFRKCDIILNEHLKGNTKIPKLVAYLNDMFDKCLEAFKLNTLDIKQFNKFTNYMAIACRLVSLRGFEFFGQATVTFGDIMRSLISDVFKMSESEVLRLSSEDISSEINDEFSLLIETYKLFKLYMKQYANSTYNASLRNYYIYSQDALRRAISEAESQPGYDPGYAEEYNKYKNFDYPPVGGIYSDIAFAIRHTFGRPAVVPSMKSVNTANLGLMELGFTKGTELRLCPEALTVNCIATPLLTYVLKIDEVNKLCDCPGDYIFANYLFMLSHNIAEEKDPKYQWFEPASYYTCNGMHDNPLLPTTTLRVIVGMLIKAKNTKLYEKVKELAWLDASDIALVEENSDIFAKYAHEVDFSIYYKTGGAFFGEYNVERSLRGYGKSFMQQAREQEKDPYGMGYVKDMQAVVPEFVRVAAFLKQTYCQTVRCYATKEMCRCI